MSIRSYTGGEAVSAVEPRPHAARTRSAEKVLAALLVGAWLFLVITRILGPSDLYDKEQPRTVAYTADMLVNHFWLMPHDTFGIPATKPPLYNWISVPFVVLFGYQEWTLKITSILASASVLVVILLAGRKTQQLAASHSSRPFAARLAAHPMALAFAAAFVWLATPMTAKLLYVARPDMLVTATLIGAWWAATLLAQSDKPRPGVAACYWLCVIASAFAKGPSALLALLYLPLAMKLLAGRWSKLKDTGWWWGLPLLLITAGLHVYCCYRQEPEFFREIILHKELGQRVTTPLQWLNMVLHGPFYLCARFLPWSIPGVLMLFLMPWRKWRTHPLTPAILWVTLITICMTFVTTNRPDRYAPAFPAMAIIAAYCLLYGLRPLQLKLAPRIRAALAGKIPHIPFGVFRLSAAYVAATALVIIIGLAVYNQFYSESATTHDGRRVLVFVNQVRSIVGNDVVLFGDGEMTPLETLLGRNQQVDIPEATLQQAKWCIRYYVPGSDALAVSCPLPSVDEDGHENKLGLYRLAPGEGPAAYQEIRNSFESAHSTTPDRWLQLEHVRPPLPPTTQSR